MVFDRNVLKATNSTDASIIDPHIDPTKSREGVVGESLHVLRLANVSGDDERRPACGARLCSDLLKQLRAAGSEHDVGVLGGECDGYTPTEPTRGAGNDKGPARD